VFKTLERKILNISIYSNICRAKLSLIMTNSPWQNAINAIMGSLYLTQELLDNQAQELLDNQAQELLDNQAQELLDNQAQELLDNQAQTSSHKKRQLNRAHQLLKKHYQINKQKRWVRKVQNMQKEQARRDLERVHLEQVQRDLEQVHLEQVRLEQEKWQTEEEDKIRDAVLARRRLLKVKELLGRLTPQDRWNLLQKV
jgi:hypothetical protein